LFVFIGGCILVTTVSAAITRSSLNRLIRRTEFLESSQVAAFAHEHHLEYTAPNVNAPWHAKDHSEQKLIDKLYKIYKPLYDAEQVAKAEADARAILDSAQESEYLSRYRKLEALKPKVVDTQLLDEITTEMTRIQPLATKEREQKEKAAKEEAERIAAEKERAERPEKAKDVTRDLFQAVNPQATINWATYQYGYTAGGKQIMVQFEYSLVNAYGTRVQRRYTCWWKDDLSEFIDEKDEFLYFRK